MNILNFFLTAILFLSLLSLSLTNTHTQTETLPPPSLPSPPPFSENPHPKLHKHPPSPFKTSSPKQMKPPYSQTRLLDRNTLISLFFFSYLSEKLVSALGSMSSIAVSYGEKGSVFCVLRSDGSHLPNCYGSNPAIIHSTPVQLPFLGLTAGSGFVCGLLIHSNLPLCWGSTNFIPMGVPLKRAKNSKYLEISAGDNHLCGLRKKPFSENSKNTSIVDCWGYNMTQSFDFDGRILSISAGSVFNCGLFASNGSVLCWGDDEIVINEKSLIPVGLKFKKIGVGGFHVCGILEEFHDTVFCSGRGLQLSPQNNYILAPKDPLLSVVGGRFHACGIRSYDSGVVCWGYSVDSSTPPPNTFRLHALAAGDYFTCGVSYERPLSPVCWGVGGPYTLPLPVSVSLCRSTPCDRGFYELNNATTTCGSSGSRVCLPCSEGCPDEMYRISECGSTSDTQCGYDCSSCVSMECVANCPHGSEKFWSFRFPIVVAEICFVVFLTSAFLLVTAVYVRCKLRKCKCSLTSYGENENGSFHKEEGVVGNRPQSSDELRIRKARTFTYEELERATNGFHVESLVGKGSFSCVYRGVLNDGSIVAVKRAIVSNDSLKCSDEFVTELDLLSRLNHAHLLNLLGYCEEGDERLLVYEFMSNGSLYQHLHCKENELRKRFDWVKRVVIAVQASRGLEYLHGYACPPVIHRDIKSSNILIDGDHNARVADFGLSLLGPTNSGAALSEPPAGTLGYLDPEYYRLHHLTTKSDVYSFGVLLLEILSGRKAIDMSYEEGNNIVEWAVPLINSNDIESVLDPVLERPADLEALRRVAGIAGKCVRMRGKVRPSMDKVTTGLERALAVLIGGQLNEQSLPILPSEVVLGSSWLHKKASQGARSSFYESDGVDGKNVGGDGWRSVVEEIGQDCPQEHLYLQHNF